MDENGLNLLAAGLSWGGVVSAALFLAFGLWEHLRPERASGEPAGQRWFANIALFVLGDGASVWVIPFLAVASSRFFLSASAPERIGWHLLPMVLVLDAVGYFLHRASHRIPWLWRLHAIHHTDLELDISTMLRHHPFETLLIGSLSAGIATLMGASPAEMTAYGVLGVGVQTLAHTNVALPPRLERLIGGVMVTPSFHRFHHALERRQHDGNYGQVLVVWDRLLGTVAPRDGMAVPRAYGVDEFLAPRFGRLRWILLQPFLPTRAASASAPAERPG